MDIKFTKEHEWIATSTPSAQMGLTDYAQKQLGDIVFLDLPAPGTEFAKSEKLAEVESVKAVSEIFSPASGRVKASNKRVVDEPGLVNADPYGEGWLVELEIKDPAEINLLMTAEEYDKYTAQLCAEHGQE